MYRSRQIPLRNKENYLEKRVIRAEVKTKQRRISRHSTFTSNRNIEADLTQEDGEETNIKGPIKSSRFEQLMEWKRKKEELKKTEAESKAKAKPPFKCGVVHHKPPPVLDVQPAQRRSQRIQNITSNKTVHERSKIQRSQPKLFKRCTKSFAPKQHEFKAPDNLPKIDEVCDSVSGAGTPDEKKTLYSFVFPVQLSPWVSRRRGSGSGHGQQSSPLSEELFANRVLTDNLRKQVGLRSVKNMLRTPQAVKSEENIPFSITCSPALSKEDAEKLKSFRGLYDGEMARLEDKCMQWDSYLSTEACQETPLESQDAIRATVGQTRLLMREKLGQFKDLLDEFERSKKKTDQPCQLITHSDLQGFWDLVSIQVCDVDAKFADLHVKKCNNWIATEAGESPSKKKGIGKVGKITAKRKHTAAAKTSVLKNFIADLRKKKKVQVEAKTEEHLLSTPKSENIAPKIMISSPKMTPRRRNSSQKAVTTPRATNSTPGKIFTTPRGGNASIIIAPQYTGTTRRSILKRGASLSARRSINIDTNTKGDARVSRTPFRVKFSDDNFSDSCGMKHPATPGLRSFKGTPAVKSGLSLTRMENSKYSNFDNDLICFDSPLRDDIPVRRSPRLQNRMD